MTNLQSNNVWALIDCDCFFVSCERLKKPNLIWKPVCVWKDIVVAKSYEAMKYWVKTWTPVWEAKKLVWDKLITLDLDHILYKKISNNLIDFLNDNFDDVQVFSIDEAFIDITNFIWLRWSKSYEELWLILQKKIYKIIWIPVSIWISKTKLLAKSFSKINKPFWITVWINEISITNNLLFLNSKDIPFLWKKSLLKLNINSWLDFASLSYDYVKKTLWENWLKIWYEYNWYNKIDFYNKDFPENIMRSYSFNPDFTNNINILLNHLFLNIENWFDEIIKLKLLFNKITVILKTKDFKVKKQHYKFNYHNNDKFLVFNKSKELLLNLISKDELYRSTWIIFWNIIKNDTSWFLLQSNDNKEILWNTINSINKKFWKNFLRSAEIKQIKKVDDKNNILFLGDVKSD